MGIFQRISDIISANFNDMVDEYEEPEKMLRQAIREMENAIQESRSEVAKTMANEKLVAKELAKNEAEVASWESRAEQAVEAGDDGLARKALARKREYEKIVEALRDQHAAAKDASETLRRQLEGMQAKLGEGQRRLGTLSARTKAATARAKLASYSGADVSLDEGAFEKFDRLSRKVEMVEAEAEAMAELSQGSVEDPSPPSASKDDMEIEAELEMLKKRKQP